MRAGPVRQPFERARGRVLQRLQRADGDGVVGRLVPLERFADPVGDGLDLRRRSLSRFAKAATG